MKRLVFLTIFCCHGVGLLPGLLAQGAAAPAAGATGPLSKDEAQRWVRWVIPLPREIRLDRRMTVPADRVAITVSPEAGLLGQRAAEELPAAIKKRSGVQVPVGAAGHRQGRSLSDRRRSDCRVHGVQEVKGQNMSKCLMSRWPLLAAVLWLGGTGAPGRGESFDLVRDGVPQATIVVAQVPSRPDTSRQVFERCRLSLELLPAHQGTVGEKCRRHLLHPRGVAAGSRHGSGGDGAFGQVGRRIQAASQVSLAVLSPPGTCEFAVSWLHGPPCFLEWEYTA